MWIITKRCTINVQSVRRCRNRPRGDMELIVSSGADGIMTDDRFEDTESIYNLIIDAINNKKHHIDLSKYYWYSDDR